MKILVVDDSDFALSMTEEIIKDAADAKGAEIVFAKDGKEAIAMFQASPEGDVKIILMDVIMPNMPGAEAVSQIRAMDREDAKTVPIVVVSAMSQEVVSKVVDPDLITEYVGKPLDGKKLVSLIEQYV